MRMITVLTPGIPTFSADVQELVDPVTLADVIHETCGRAELRPTDIEWVLPAPIDSPLIREINLRCRLRPERVWNTCADIPGYLCAADTPARLDALLRSITPTDGQRALVWSAGLQRQVGCALLEFCGAGS